MTETSVNPEMTPDDGPTLLTVEQFTEQTNAAKNAADDLQASITQKEWLLIRRALDMTRAEVILDGGIRLVALAWVKAYRTHGGASWDTFLAMTDDQVMELHGFPTVLPAGYDADEEHQGNITIREEEARAKAEFCLRLHIAASDYDHLNDIERLAFKTEAERIRAELDAKAGA